MSAVKPTPTQQAEMLAQCARLLERQVGRTARRTKWNGNQRIEAQWDWPGVLTAIDLDTGQVLAVSKPGQPFVLAD